MDKTVWVDHAIFEQLDKGKLVVLDRVDADKLLGGSRGYVDIATTARDFRGQVIECIISKGVRATTISSVRKGGKRVT